MDRTYLRKQGDRKVDEYFPSGSISAESYLVGDGPANGWSRKAYYENGCVRQEQCFSHSVLIEQIDYDQHGQVSSHKIYSHGLKQLIDKPKQEQVIRPNVVSGCAHMGTYYRDLPKIAAFIEADYHEASLDAAYEDYQQKLREAEECYEPSEVEEPEYSWTLTGKEMAFKIWFEKHEMLYFWSLFARTEENYHRATVFMEGLRT